MFWSLIRTIVILPGTALVFVPGVIVWATQGSGAAVSLAGPGTVWLWAGIVLAVPGVVLAATTVRLFATRGKGTPAPWDPPKNLVVLGPYRWVRNPMISGVLFLLAAEALIMRSWPVAAWGGFFYLANSVYFPLSEEPGLERRFGDAYRSYKANVPRWLPRLTPWRQPDEDKGG